MEGALIKSYYAEKTGIPAKDIYVLSIMPCIAKKFEAQRPELKEQYPDVDAVLTTRELARMIKNAGIDFNKLGDEHFDDPMGESTGAAAIFGAAGGVMEAALRTAHFFITGKEMENVEFTPVRGLQGVKEGEVTLNGITIRIAAVSGLKNIAGILDKIRSGENTYQFIEVMACPNGCINGGGQPISSDPDKIRKRMEAIYAIDRALPKRASHHNESVMQLYREYLGEPNGHKSHDLLHTHYVERS
jgi:iron only hydrogenase large subunit-like protein